MGGWRTATASRSNCDLSLDHPLCVRREQGDGSLTSILDVTRLHMHISIHNNIDHAVAYHPRAEGVQSEIFSRVPTYPNPAHSMLMYVTSRLSGSQPHKRCAFFVAVLSRPCATTSIGRNGVDGEVCTVATKCE